TAPSWPASSRASWRWTPARWCRHGAGRAPPASSPQEAGDMTLTRLLLRNLLYHWRGNLAVLLGVVVGTAVLTGALLVGDSLRGSLRDLTLRRLGWVDQALVGSRFFRASLADNLPASRAAPLILLRASAAKPAGGALNRVTVLGIDRRFGLSELPESS